MPKPTGTLLYVFLWVVAIAGSLIRTCLLNSAGGQGSGPQTLATGDAD